MKYYIDDKEIYDAEYNKYSREFFKVYIDIAKIISQLTNPEAKFLLVISSLMDWNNKIVLNEITKIKLMTYMGYKKEHSVEKLITPLVKKGFLTRTATNEYTINEIFITKKAELSVQLEREKQTKKREELAKKLFSKD